MWHSLNIVMAQGGKLQFNVKGKVIGRDTGFICLNYLNENYKSVKDTTFLEKGKFSFHGYIAEPSFASIIGNSKLPSTENGDFTVFCLEPGDMELFLVENKYNQAQIAGSKTQAEWDTLKESQAIIKKRSDSLDANISFVNERDSINKKEMIRLQHQEAIKQSEIEFIKEHSESYLSPYFLRRYVQELSLDSIKMLFDNLNPKIQNSKIGKILYTQIHGKSIEISKGQAPNFVREDINGRKTDLSSFKGKSYVILDFWASWCIPCRKNTEELKKIYDKYHSKGLNIIAISLDSDQSEWRNAVNKDSISSWKHVLSKANIKASKFSESQKDISNQYAVTPIPVEILIDKNGNIIGRYDGSESITVLIKKLSKIFR